MQIPKFDVTHFRQALHPTLINCVFNLNVYFNFLEYNLNNWSNKTKNKFNVTMLWSEVMCNKSFFVLSFDWTRIITSWCVILLIKKIMCCWTAEKKIHLHRSVSGLKLKSTIENDTIWNSEIWNFEKSQG